MKTNSYLQGFIQGINHRTMKEDIGTLADHIYSHFNTQFNRDHFIAGFEAGYHFATTGTIYHDVNDYSKDSSNVD